VQWPSLLNNALHWNAFAEGEERRMSQQQRSGEQSQALDGEKIEGNREKINHLSFQSICKEDNKNSN
jgi:hypothetical protein